MTRTKKVLMFVLAAVTILTVFTIGYDSPAFASPSGDILLTTVTWTGATSYTCGMDLPETSKMVTISVDSGYFTISSLGSVLTFRGGTSGTDYIANYGSTTHYDSAVFSFADASLAETLLSEIVYSLDNTTPQTITATSSTVSPVLNDIFFEGHYYRYVDSGFGSIDWPTAVLAAGATADPYFGGRGYIATATTQAENSILLRLVENGAGGSDHWDDAWMGALWERNTGTLASPTIVRGIDGNEISFDDLNDVSDITTLLKDYTKDFSFGFNGSDSSTFICNNYDNVRYYWIDGPEAGEELSNNTGDFAPWHATGLAQDEPNSGDFIYIGWQGAYWDDLSAYDGDAGTAFDKLDGYIVEFSGFDGGSSAGVIREDSKTTSAYTATIRTYIDGSPAAAPGAVELRQSGVTVAAAASSVTGVYTSAIHNGTYDIYIGSTDTGVDITVSGAANNVNVNYFTVSFSVTDAGTALGSTVSAMAGGSVITSGAVVLAGKTVVITAAGAGATAYTYSWSGNGTGGETTAEITIASLNSTVDADCTITGTTLITVTFDAEGGSVTPLSQIKQLGSTYGKAPDGTDEALPTPAKTGYNFSGWWTGDNGTGSEVTNATTVSTASNHTLYAKWTANTYAVSFDAEDGNVSPSSQDKLFNSPYGKAPDGTDEALPTPAKTGYTFSGWWTGDNGTGIEVTNATKVSTASNHTLYAKWTANTYTVIFDAEGGSVSPGTQNKLFGSAYGKAPDGADEALPTPSRTGYTFGGWWTEDNGTGSEVLNATTVSTDSNHTLYAKWTIRTFTVTFNDWDGTVINKQTVKYCGAAAAPDDPERTGYTFIGWNKEFDSVTFNMNVMAQYTVNYYSVTFNSNGGSSVPGQNVKFFESASKPADPTLEGYIFGGWYSDSGFSKIYDFSAQVTADITLFAEWTEAAQTAKAAAQLLTMETAFRFAENDTWECVTSSFVMLGSSSSGAQITWMSSNTDIVRIEQNADKDAAGFVTRPQNNDTSVVITAAVTKNGETVYKTFLLIVKRQGALKDETRQITERIATVQTGEGTGSETICRTTLNDGTGIDYVVVTIETVQALIEQVYGADHIAVKIENDNYNPADEFAFEVSSDTVSLLVQNKLGISLESPAGKVMLSFNTLEHAASSTASLYFRIVPAAHEANEAKKAFLGDGAIFSSGVTGQVFGTPKTIQTNMESFAATITLPLEGLNEEQLSDEEFQKTLCVYVEHDDGTKELIYGTLIFTDKVPTGIRFDISKFSRFQVVNVKQAAAVSPWIWIACIVAGMLILLIILAAVSRRRSRTQ